MYAKGKKLEGRRHCKVGGLGACSAKKFVNLAARKCYFLRYPQDILENTKENANG